jgi:RNA polymerase sigma factor (sigma-70 family)
MRDNEEELIPTRVSLLGRLKNWNDQASWQQFFDTYWKLIYGVARRSGLSDTEAQDVVQETMVSVAKHMPGFTYDARQGSFKAWLLNMTRWRIIDQVRRRAKSPGALPGAGGDSDTTAYDQIVDPASNALDAVWDEEWQSNLLRAAVSRVRMRVEPQSYQLFDFYVNKEWTPDRVASTFNVSVNQVYLAKHRIAELLKAEVARLEQEGN